MIGKGIAKGINAIGGGTLRFAKKHPAITLGGVGVGVGLANAAGPAQKARNNVMREYLGAPGAKYSSCELMEEFAERKMSLAAKIAFEKGAEIVPFNTGVSQGAGKALGGGVISEGLGALRRLIGYSSQAVSERYVQDPKRKKIVSVVKHDDPVVSTAERENPGQADQAYNTMRRFAPTLSTDPSVVTSFLRNSALTGGPMDFQTIKGLADAEHAVQRAKNEGAWLKGGL